MFVLGSESLLVSRQTGEEELEIIHWNGCCVSDLPFVWEHDMVSWFYYRRLWSFNCSSFNCKAKKIQWWRYFDYQILLVKKKMMCTHILKMYVCVLAVLGIEPRVLHILGKLSYSPTPLLIFNFESVSLSSPGWTWTCNPLTSAPLSSIWENVLGSPGLLIVYIWWINSE